MRSDGRDTYNLGFTSAALRPEAARILAEAYLETGSWEAARERVLASNALQARASRSAERLEGELRLRLMELTTDQLSLLARATAEDRAALAWLAAVKRIAFVYEFAAETLREKLGEHDSVLRRSDYEAYVESQTVLHPRLGELAESSRTKIRQVLMKMLTEAGLLVRGEALGEIRRPVLSPEVRRVIAGDDPRWFAAFLVPDDEVPAL